MKYLRRTIPLIILGIFLTACSLGGVGTPEVEQPAGPVTIRVAALPVLDTLPMYVAAQEGLFEKNGVKVDFIPAGSAPKRDELIAAGQADAMVNEIVSVMFFNRESTRVQVVRYARTATSESPLFRILTAANSGIESVDALKGVEIGVSKGTVIEYITDRLLQAEGFLPGDIKTIAVPDIGQRLALLTSGELKAGVLPDPLSSLAIAQGAKVILDDTRDPEISHSVYSFRKEFIDQNPQAVKGFLAAIEEAVRLINEKPDRWGDLLAEQKLVPVPLLKDFKLPAFVTAGVPSESQWNDAMSWAKESELIKENISYADSITSSFLP